MTYVYVVYARYPDEGIHAIYSTLELAKTTSEWLRLKYHTQKGFDFEEWYVEN